MCCNRLRWELNKWPSRLILSNEKAALAEDGAILAKLSYLVRNYKDICEKLK